MSGSQCYYLETMPLITYDFISRFLFRVKADRRLFSLHAVDSSVVAPMSWAPAAAADEAEASRSVCFSLSSSSLELEGGE